MVPGNSNNSTTHLKAMRQINVQLKSPGQPTRTLSLLDLSASSLLKQAEKQGEENPGINDICGSLQTCSLLLRHLVINPLQSVLG